MILQLHAHFEEEFTLKKPSVRLFSLLLTLAFLISCASGMALNVRAAENDTQYEEPVSGTEADAFSPLEESLLSLTLQTSMTSAPSRLIPSPSSTASLRSLFSAALPVLTSTSTASQI